MLRILRMGESVKSHEPRHLLGYIGPPRLAPYFRETDRDVLAAFRLYEWNAELSTALWLPLCHLEIAVRNVLSEALESAYRKKSATGSWVDRPSVILKGREEEDVEEAKKRACGKGKPSSPGQVLSELSFGFWRYLTGNRYRATLWPFMVRKSPYAPNRELETVAKPIVRLHKTRNRLAHHEPIWNHEPMASYRDILTLAGYMSPALKDWIEGQAVIDAIWQADPRRAT